MAPSSRWLTAAAAAVAVVVREVDGVDTIQIRPMAYVSLTIDHRVVGQMRVVAADALDRGGQGRAATEESGGRQVDGLGVVDVQVVPVRAEQAHAGGEAHAQLRQGLARPGGDVLLGTDRGADLQHEAVDQAPQRRGDVGIVATNTGVYLRLLLA